jgi:translation initiation factor 2B subunit (eIF-2B alpha/beta/delta family)
MKYVSRAFVEHSEFASCKHDIQLRAESFANMSMKSRSIIANIGNSFIQNDCTILVYGNSRVVNGLLLKAAETKYFHVIIPEGRPQKDG